MLPSYFIMSFFLRTAVHYSIPFIEEMEGFRVTVDSHKGEVLTSVACASAFRAFFQMRKQLTGGFGILLVVKTTILYGR